MNKKQKSSTDDKIDIEDVLLIKFYKEMLLIRRFEEKAGQLYGMGLIGGFCHLYIGQEAVVVGMQNCIKQGDSTITSYRDHGHIIVSGVSPKSVMAELTGRATGCSKGKGGSMHMFDTKTNFYGGHGIVGAQVPIGTGLAFAAKYKNNDNISLTYFGDGAIHQGQVYESFNMAALWKLPVIYIIENNEYAMGTSVKRSTISTELFKRGEAFGIPGIQLNGMDIFEIYNQGKKIVDHVRSGNGPMLIEMKTYRFRGHSMSDPAKYRKKEELTDYRDVKDPISNLKKYILDKNILKDDDFTNIEKDIKMIINDAAAFATNSKEPEIEELYTDIYNRSDI